MPTFPGRNICSLLIRIAALLVLGQVSLAQIDTASIIGTIKDPSGAVVAKAKVNLQNTATNEVKTAFSDADGFYSFPYLRVGTYSMTTEAAGFKASVRNNVVLNVQDRKQVDFQLQVGSNEQQVDVTAEAPLLDNVTADVGYVVSGQQATDLPLNGRRYDVLTGLTAGVNTSSPSFQQRAEGVFSVNGNSSTQNNFVLDGGDNNSYTTNLQDQSAQGVQPAVDSLAEFKLQTRDYDVEYGRSAGGVVNAAIKSGTNSFHGDVYEYFRNDNLDARDYFATTGSKPILQQNQFGFTLGGPIRKNKTFFFVNWEGRRIRNGLTLQSLVPTPQMRNLDFTEFANLPTSPNIPGMPQLSNCINNGVLTNDSTCVDPTALSLLALYPLPNLNTSSQGVPGSFTYGANFVAHPKASQDSDEGAVRIDHRFSDADNVYGHLVIFDFRQNRPGIFNDVSPIADGTNDSTSGINLNRGTSITLAWVHMFRPNLVNDGHFSFIRVASHNLQATLGKNVNAQFGLNGIPLYPGLSGGLPEIDISGMQLLGSPMWLPQNQFAQIWQLKDAVTFIKGTHSLKMGFEWRRDADNFSDLCCIRGNYSFNSQYTRQGITDFLMGLPNHAELENLNIARVYRNGWNWFVGDSWRAHPKLTLNYGVRYEYSSPLFERDNHETNFDPSLNGGQGGLFTIPSNASGTFNRTTVHPSKNNFAPRAGFAYSLTPKLVMRGGFGVYYQNYYRYGSESMLALDPPFLVDAQANAQPGQAPTILLRNGFPSNFLAPVDVNDTNAVAQLFIRAIDSHLKPSTIYQASYGFQYSVASNFVVEANYVMNRGRHIWDLVNENQPHLVHPGSPPVPAFPNFVQTSGSPTFIEWLTAFGNSTYNGLQISADRRFSHGIGLHVAYTWSKALSQDSDFEAGLRGVQDRYNPKGEWGYWDNDTPHRLVVSGTYELPAGKGHHVASSGAMEKVLGGWQLNSIATFASGQPVKIGITQDNSQTGSGNRPDCVAPTPGFHRSLNDWVNPSGYAAPAQFTFGNCSPTPGPRAPGVSLVDMSLFKNFNFSESKYLQFRFELFNFINKPQFGPPSNLTWDTSQPGTPGAPVPGFGAITSTVPNLQRQIQFALKFYF